MCSATCYRGSPVCTTDPPPDSTPTPPDPRGPRPSSRRVADRFVAIDSRVRFMTASDPRPDMTEVIGNDDLLPLILDTQSAGRRAPPSSGQHRGAKAVLDPRCVAAHRSGCALNPLWNRPRSPRFRSTPCVGVSSIRFPRTSRWIRRARRAGYPCTLRWIRRAGRGGHAVHVAVNTPCTSRRIRRARRAGYAMSVAVDTPQSRRRTTGLSDRVEPILR